MNTASVIDLINNYQSGNDGVTEIQLDELKAAIDYWNKEYRAGNSIVDDSVYDSAVEMYEMYRGEITDTHADIENSERKQKLPIVAASMNKCKTIPELLKWAISKGFDFMETLFTLSPKFDGITLVAQESAVPVKVWTKGRDGYGLFVPDHFNLTNHGISLSNVVAGTVYSRGEAIIRKSIFAEKYDRAVVGKNGFENPRNMVSGKFTDKETTEALKHVDYIRFSLDSETAMYLNKSQQFDILNQVNKVQIPFIQIMGKDITDEKLHDIFTEWASGEYEIDGLIIDIDDAKLRHKLGLETSSLNPCYARAFKGNWEDCADTEVVAIKRQVSKQKYLKPVIVIKPVRLNGVTVTNAFADNERWMHIYGIGIGTKLTIKRSGMVIPRISAVEGVKVLDNEIFSKLAKRFDGTNVNEIRGKIGLGDIASNYKWPVMDDNNVPFGQLKWNDTCVEIMLVDESDEVKIQKNIAFFEIIGADGISDGTIAELWEKGYKTIPQILNLANNPGTIASWEGWGGKSAELLCSAIIKAMDEVKPTKLMHATGLFGKLGSKILDLVQHFDTKPTYQQLIDTKGFSDIYATAYLNGYDKFQDFIREINYIPKKVENTKPAITGNKCSKWKVTFTQFRDANLESLIMQNGGEIKDNISGNSTHLILLDKGKGTSKETRASKVGAKIWTREELVDYLSK